MSKLHLSMTLLAAALLWIIPAGRASAAEAVSLEWLDKAPPPTDFGVSWGVPWPKGAVSKGQTFTLKSVDGQSLPLQSWPLAYWPDGSIKWTGFATVGKPGLAGPLQVMPAAETARAEGEGLKVDQGDTIVVDTGRLVCRIPRSGPYLVASMTVEGREVARNGQFECILQSAPDGEPAALPPPREEFSSQVQKVTVEQGGPVRAVVKIEGVHKARKGSREWLPFVARLYFYAGQLPVRMVLTTTFDGDQQKDFIRGLGVSFEVPMRERPQNRHVRFANSNGGVWAEPLQLAGFGGRGRGAPAGATGPAGTAARGGGQLDGQRLPDPATPSAAAEWDGFKLTQLTSEGFSITKRTGPASSWVAVGEGRRAAGLAFIGDVGGGLAVGVKNFWQSSPASLEVEGALSETAHLHAWLWSPDGPSMDLRHYDTHGHGNVNTGGSYEDYEPEFATPFGVARTSELTLFPCAAAPSREQTAQFAAVNSFTPLLVASPRYLHSTGVFGVWSLPDRSTAFRQQVEDRLQGAIDFYRNAIDEHHWYGYWNYGDIRHAYDAARHEWRYDVGGYAWDNTELGSVLWVWYSYVRTGRADTFRMAEAMIRHTSEVDTYHLGPYKGLGSRHNVSHWGDSAKEPRVSQAAHAHSYYFLTTDERTGDLMHDAAMVDEVASKLDPMRKAQPATEADRKYPGRIRFGPDWLAFAGNWMIEWERTGDTRWRDRIMAGVDSMYDMPYWTRTGRNLVMGYDYRTGRLYPLDDQVGRYNLTTIQGGGEVAAELTDLLDDPKWTKMWLQYCRLGTAGADVLARDKESGSEGADASMVGEQGGSNSQGTPRLAAYAYYKTKNPAFAQVAMRAFAGRADSFVPTRVDGSAALNPVEEAPGVSFGGTNSVAQNSLMMIEILELCADRLPAEPLPPPAAPAFGTRQGRGGGRAATRPAD